VNFHHEGQEDQYIRRLPLETFLTRGVVRFVWLQKTSVLIEPGAFGMKVFMENKDVNHGVAKGNCGKLLTDG
jgi:hypothetical protein